MASDPLKDYLEKKAGPWGDAASSAFRSVTSPANIMGGMAGAARGAVGAAAVAGLGVGARAIYDAATKSRDFKAMLAENDDVAQMHAEKPREVNRMFSTLRHYTPEFTTDPMVAGAYMRQMVGSPEGVNGFMTQAIDSRAKLIGSQRSKGFGEIMQDRALSYQGLESQQVGGNAKDRVTRRPGTGKKPARAGMELEGFGDEYGRNPSDAYQAMMREEEGRPHAAAQTHTVYRGGKPNVWEADMDGAPPKAYHAEGADKQHRGGYSGGR